MLNQLPSPPQGKKGWPWTEESEELPPLRPDGGEWPSISIITPSFNQGHFIEETIRSVILQNYPSLEYIIIDGCSTDDSVEIIRKYEPWIAFWVSEKDKGQSEAINKGFRKCSGDLVNWICSDDLLFKNALFSLAPVIIDNPASLFIGEGVRIDHSSVMINEIEASSINTLEKLVKIGNYWRKGDSIMQQSCLYPPDTVKSIGYLNENNHFTMDFELWGKLLKADIPVIRCNVPVGMFRWYEGQKTSNLNLVTKSLVKTAVNLIINYTGFSRAFKISLLFNVCLYYLKYWYHNLRSILGIKRRFKQLLNGGSCTIY